MTTPQFSAGYEAGLLYRTDQRGQGKPCGRGFISSRKKCSPEKAKQLATDLKAGDEGAKKRVAIGKRNAQNTQKLKGQVKAAKAKRAQEEDAKPDSQRKKPRIKDMQAEIASAWGEKSWKALQKNPTFQMELDGMAERGLKAGSEELTRKLYRRHVGRPHDEQNPDANKHGVINGVDVKRNFLPWKVFDLNPKTATKDDVKKAFRRLSKQYHPDVGGDREIFERLKTMKESLDVLFD